MPLALLARWRRQDHEGKETHCGVDTALVGHDSDDVRARLLGRAAWLWPFTAMAFYGYDPVRLRAGLQQQLWRRAVRLRPL
jgi:hypothetical protein